MEDTRSRFWCFTINNWIAADLYWCNTVKCSYIVVGKEIGTKEETPHLQGYIKFTQRKRFSTVKKMRPNAHWETRKGTAEQASDYCKKADESPLIRGEISIPEQGKRTDLEVVATEILAGVPMAKIAGDHPTTYIRYNRGMEMLRFRTAKPRAVKPYVVWISGKTGTGKTRMAVNAPSVYIKDNTKWWDGYDGQKRVVIDDFDAKMWDLRDLLRVLDRYEYHGQIKGGYVSIAPDEIYITSDRSTRCWYQKLEWDQVNRRIDREINSDLFGFGFGPEVAGNTIPPPSEKEKGPAPEPEDDD